MAKPFVGGVQALEYRSVSCIGPTAPPDDFGVVAVIDGNMLKVTPMRLANIPPPMALHELSLHGNATDIAVSAKDGVTILGVLFDDALSCYEWRLPEDYKKEPILKWTAKTPSSVEVPSSQVVSPERCINRSVFFDQENRLSTLQSTVPGSFIAIAESGNGGVYHSIRSFEDDRIRTGSGSARQTIEVSLKGGENSLPIRSTFVHSSTGRLTLNGRDLARNCTSFLTTPAHLIFTTSQHLLKFVHMTTAEHMVVPGDTPEVDERCRNIERGAKLVTVIPSTFALVLQMPRGNLETIYPRALVLAGIRDSIQEKRYKKAFLACRNQRVDMNILHDYHPEAFVADIELFVGQVRKVEHIDLFLSQLRYFVPSSS